MQQGVIAHGLALAAIGKAFALSEGIAQFVFVFPATRIHQVVDIGAVGAFGVAKHPQRCGLKVAPMLGLISQRMFAHKVLIFGLVCRGRQKGSFCQQPNLHRQQISKNAGQGDHHIHTWTLQFTQGHQLGSGQTSIRVKARTCAHKVERLRQGATFRLEVVGAPQHHGHGFGITRTVCGVTGQEFVGLNSAVTQSKGCGQTEGINAMQISTGGQDVGIANQVAAGGRLDIPCIQGTNQALHLVLLAQQLVGFDQFFKRVPMGSI